MTFDVNYILLVINIIFWVITIYLYQRRKSFFDAGSVILFSYLLYSVLSLFLFYDPFWGDGFNKLNIFPFIYLYFMLMLAAWPVLKFDQLKILEIQQPSNILYNTIGLILIASTFACFGEGIPKVASGFTKILFDSTAGMAIYKDTMEASEAMNIGDGKISNLPSIISGLLADIGILMFFYNLTLKKRNLLFTICLFIAAVYPILDQIAVSQRGPVIDRLFTIIISFFALRKFIPPRINKVIKATGVLLVIVIVIPLIAITSSRFDRPDSSGAMSSLLFYAGQQNLYFNNYGLDNGGLRYGDRTFPMFKRMMGFDNVPHNFYERRAKYPNLKINDEVFVGFVGDFTLDFGPILAPLIFLFFFFLVLKLTKVRNGKILFHQLVLLHFVMCISIQGGMKLFSYSDVSNLKIITIFIAYIVFRLDYEQIRAGRIKMKSANLTLYANS